MSRRRSNQQPVSCVHLFTCLLVAVSTSVATAGAVQWSDVIEATTAADISLAGTHVDAVNISTGLDPIVVDFGSESISFRSSQNQFASATGQGDFYTAGGGDSGNASLNMVFDSHGWASTDSTLAVAGLTPGQAYQIQIIAAADRRDCCQTRNQIISDGMGALTDDLSRMGPGSVIGTFTADAESQFFRVGVGFENGVDPGLSAYIVRAVPEAQTLSVLLLAGIVLVARRRNR